MDINFPHEKTGYACTVILATELQERIIHPDAALILSPFPACPAEVILHLSFRCNVLSLIAKHATLEK